MALTGDKNSRFLHTSTVIIDHFQNIYKSNGFQNLFEFVSYIPQLVDDKMYSVFMKLVYDPKIKEAIFSLAALKAPG